MDTAYIKRIGFYFLLALLALALIISLVYHAFDGLSDDLELMFLKKTTYTESFEMKAYLSLNEHFVEGSCEDGALLEYVSGESARISSGDTLVRVYASGADASLVAKIKKLSEEIEFCKKVSVYVARQSVEYLKAQIEKCEKDISATNDLTEKNELRTELRALLAAHAAKMDSSVSYSDIIKGYENEISAAYSALGKAKAEYTADMNGAYFAQCDGYESMFDWNDISEGGLDSLYDAVSQAKPSQNVGKLGKIADMNTWRLVCITDKSSSLRMIKGKRLNVTLGASGSNYTLTVERVVTERYSDKAVVILTSSLMLDCEDYAHFQTVKVDVGSKSGYKIPISAVRYENGISGVYVLRGSMVRFRQIDIIGSGDGYVVAATGVAQAAEGVSVINRYDRIIVRGHNLYDRKVII